MAADLRERVARAIWARNESASWDSMGLELERSYYLEDADAVLAELGPVIAAARTLEGMRYTYHGGEQWKPPLGKRPAWLDEPQPQAEPVGEWVMVPREPTEAMWEAASVRVNKNTVTIGAGPMKGATLVRDPIGHAFRAFLEAAPAAPQPQAEAVGDMPDRLRGLAESLERRRYPENAALIREAAAMIAAPQPAHTADAKPIGMVRTLEVLGEHREVLRAILEPGTPLHGEAVETLRAALADFDQRETYTSGLNLAEAVRALLAEFDATQPQGGEVKP